MNIHYINLLSNIMNYFVDQEMALKGKNTSFEVYSGLNILEQ